MSPLDMLWTSIRIAWTKLLHSQEIMYVQDIEDETKVLKKRKREMVSELVGAGKEAKFKTYVASLEEEWEYQHAWEKQGRALTSQTAVMGRLTSMIKQYEAMLRTLPTDEVNEEQRLRVSKLKAEVKELTGGNKEPTQIYDDIGSAPV